MNEFGQRVMRHWQRFLPSRYSGLEDPVTYFTSVGEQIAEQITTACERLERQNAEELSSMDYLGRVGLMNTLRRQAIEAAMDDFLLEPEPTSQEEATMARERHEQEVRDRLRDVMDKDGMPLDRQHRLWEMLDDPDVTPQQFAQASLAWEETLRARAERELRQGTDTKRD